MTALPMNVTGCNRCGTRWVGPNTPCWMCHRPGREMPRPSISDGGERSGAPGMYADIVAAKARGPMPSDDPCGGGPL